MNQIDRPATAAEVSAVQQAAHAAIKPMSVPHDEAARFCALMAFVDRFAPGCFNEAIPKKYKSDVVKAIRFADIHAQGYASRAGYLAAVAKLAELVGGKS